MNLQPENIPGELKLIRQWVCSRAEVRDGKPTKVPVNPHTGANAAVNDPESWSDFAKAEAAAMSNNLAGVGFVLTADDDFFALDLDKCRDATTGVVEQWAADIVAAFPTYREITPSGCGLRVIGIGKLPPGRRRDGRLEMYDSGRFVTTTGRALPESTSSVTDCQEQLTALHQRVTADAEARSKRERPQSGMQTQTQPSGQPGDAETLQRALVAFNARPQYASDSEADLALCNDLAFYCGPDPARIDILFRQSGRLREKWDRKHFADGTTYGHATIQKALDGRTDFYGQRSAPVIALPAGPVFRKPLSVRELCEQKPDLRPAVIDGLLRRGEFMNLIAAPKVGKSWLTIALALCIASGRWLFDRFPTTAGKVLIIDNELHGETSANRIPKVAEAMGLYPEQYADQIFVDNQRGRLVTADHLPRYFDQFYRGEFAMFLLDAMYRIYPKGVSENDNAGMADVYNTLDRCTEKLDAAGAGVHHASKGNQAGKDVTDVGAGAGSQSRAADTHLVLRPHEQPGHVVADAAVRSFPPIDPFVLQWQFPLWNAVEGMDPSALKRPERDQRRAADKRERTENVMEAVNEIVDVLGRRPEGETKRGLEDAIGGRKCRIGTALEQLRKDGIITTCELKRSNGQVYAGFKLTEMSL